MVIKSDFYTAADKLAAIEREIKYRKNVYPRMVDQKRMSEAQMHKQIAIFEAIAVDYYTLAEKERLI